MRLALAPGALALLALACATATPTAARAPRTEASAATTAVDAEWVDGRAAEEPAGAAPVPEAEAEKAPEYRTYRLGFWEFDLMAVDLEPRGTTFRLLDLAIFKLLEVGSGPDYHAFSLVEIPPLVSLFSTRHEEDTGELKLLDVQAFGLALVRHERESETDFATHFLKLPVLGSTFAREHEEGLEKQHVLYVFRRELED
jgi:hypothetical protein